MYVYCKLIKLTAYKRTHLVISMFVVTQLL